MEGETKMFTKIELLTAALEQAQDKLIWMSGSPSFGPEGEAGKAFVRTVRPLIRRISDVLPRPIFNS